jgi:hypothetical protein
VQPILAESAPYRGRAVVLAVVLAAVASLAMVPRGHHRTRHNPHHLRLAHDQCSRGHVYLVR